jgi:hypothetical protein
MMRPLPFTLLTLLLLPLRLALADDAWFDVTLSEEVVLNMTVDRLDAGAAVDYMYLDTPFGQDGITMLMSASARKLEQVVSLLLERGGQPNLQNAWGWCALHFAAAGGNVAIVTMLLERGGRTDRLSYSESYPAKPVDIAIHYGHEDVVERLTTPFPPPWPPMSPPWSP